MLTGDLPFHSDNRKTTMTMILKARLSMPQFLSQSAQSLLRKLFKRVPSARLGANGLQELQAHPFFADVDWKQLMRREVVPPFKPTLAQEDDSKYFDKQYTAQAPIDSPGMPASAGANDLFRGFSFIAPSVVEPGARSPPKPLRHSLHPRVKLTSIKADYDLQDQVLGAGSFSECRRAVHKATGKEFAVKIIEKTKRDPEDEVDILFRYGSHPNIMTLYEAYADQDHVYLVTELMHGGELLDRILQAGHLYEPEARATLCKLVQVIEYLHGQGVVHRDLKPSNILYATARQTVDDIRIADFGFAKQVGKFYCVGNPHCYRRILSLPYFSFYVYSFFPSSL